MQVDRPRRLLLAIHDVSSRFEGEVDRLRDHLAPHVPPARTAMLVVPNHWGDALLVPSSPFARRLRGWADAGAEIFVHGWFHRDTTIHAGAMARFKASRMTAGEGEFLGLDRAEAQQRMIDGKVLIENVIGRSVAGFVAPAWLYGPAAIALLGECGFALAEDHLKVWQPSTGDVLAHGPVITWASRSRARIASSLVAAALLPALLRRASVARVAVHPGDAGVPILMRSIADTLRRLGRTHAAARYSDLVPDRTSSCAY